MRYSILAAGVLAALPINALAQDGLALWVARCDEPADGKTFYNSVACKIFRNGMEWQRQKQNQDWINGTTLMVRGTRNGQPVILQETANVPFQPNQPEIYYEIARGSELLNSLDPAGEPPLIMVTPRFEAIMTQGGGWRPASQQGMGQLDAPPTVQEDIR